MLTRNNLTLSERVTNPAFRAGADWIVVDNFALRIETTSALTRVLTFRVDTSLCRRTFSVGHTLWTTLWRYAKVS